MNVFKYLYTVNYSNLLNIPIRCSKVLKNCKYLFSQPANRSQPSTPSVHLSIRPPSPTPPAKSHNEDHLEKSEFFIWFSVAKPHITVCKAPKQSPANHYTIMIYRYNSAKLFELESKANCWTDLVKFRHNLQVAFFCQGSGSSIRIQDQWSGPSIKIRPLPYSAPNTGSQFAKGSCCMKMLFGCILDLVQVWKCILDLLLSWPLPVSPLHWGTSTSAHLNIS